MAKKRKYVQSLNPGLEGKTVVISGWAQEIRDLKKIKFILLRDRTGIVQCIGLPNEAEKRSFDLISEVTKESVVEIAGKIKKSEQAKQGFEVVIKKLKLLGKAEPLPIDISGKIETSLDKRLDFRFLDTRRPEINAIFRIRSEIFAAAVEFFVKKGFVNINTPKLTIIGVESGAALFEVDYFDKKAYLSQSPQVYKEMFVSGGFERVFEIGPVFRAEKHHTTRHLTEFTGIDFEMGFIKDENDIMDTIESLLMAMIKSVMKNCSKEFEILKINLEAPKKIPRIPMKECKALLAEKGKVLPEDEDLDTESEKMLGDIIQEKFGNSLVFITRYPFKVRPFYHMKPDNDKTSTRSFDLLWNGVEIATGAQREHRFEILKAQAKEKGLNLDEMEDYANIFRFGMPPHGGVGFGLDRIAQRILKLENIREAILLPRDPERIRP